MRTLSALMLGITAGCGSASFPSEAATDAGRSDPDWTEPDRAVFDSILRHLVAHTDTLSVLTPRDSRSIMVNPLSLSDVVISEGQMRIDLNEDQWDDIRSLIGHLRLRNAELVRIDSLVGETDLIRVEDPVAWRDGWLTVFSDVYPGVRCSIVLCLPGYSGDGRSAVVRFVVGPTSHGSAGIFYLEEGPGGWGVKWMDITYRS